MEFLVEFEIAIPVATPESEVAAREGAEALTASKLVDEGHLVRVDVTVTPLEPRSQRSGSRGERRRG
jgi:hypothetical protein